MTLLLPIDTAPSREQLAKELADRNDRCGDIDHGRICLRPKNHEWPHVWESIRDVVPFD